MHEFVDDFTDIGNERDASLHIKVSVSGLRKWRATGQGPKFYRLGRLIRYKRSDLDEWLESHKSVTTGEANHAQR